MTGGALLIELFVALLLAATIGYCVVLDRRLKQLRADEGVMRRTIGDLAQATDNAERAIAMLKQTVAQADASLAVRLESAERFTADLSGGVRAGEEIFGRLRRIVEMGRLAGAPPHPDVVPAIPPEIIAAKPIVEPPLRAANPRLQAAALAAERLAERARARQRAEAA